MKLSRLLAAAAAPALVLGVMTPSHADDISNNLDPSIDAVAEVMSLNVGGPTGSTQLYVSPANGDGKNGCNLTGSTTLTLSVSSSNPAAATVSPSSVTFGACGDTRTLTVTPVAVGSTNVTVAQTSNNTGGTFNLAPAGFTVNVAPPANTAPTVAVAGVTGGASYEQGSVPAATCQVTDAEDGASSFDADLSEVTGPYAAVGIGSQDASCSYTDGGGLTAQSSVTYNIVPVPNTAPSVSIGGVADGETYAKGSVPDATCDVVDAEDGDSSSAADLSEITGPHANVGIGSQTASCSYTDGGDITGEDELSDQASVTYDIVPVANTAPTVEVSGVTDGAEYQLGSVPAAGCDVTDAEDGDSSFDADLSEVTGPHANVGIGSQTATCSHTDSGNIIGEDKLGDQASVTYNIVPVPNTAPTVEVTGVTDGAEYYLGSVPAAGCDVTDAEDGDSSFDADLSEVTGPHANVGIGSQTATCSYTDGGDITGEDKLSDQASVTYTIVPVPNTAPTVEVSGVAGGESYDKGDVPTAMCDVVDAEDGNSSFEAELSEITGPYSSDGIGEQTASCSYIDNGNIIGEDKLSDGASVTYSIVDPTAPEIDYALTPSTPDGANGWYVGDVSVDWTVKEPESPNSLSKTGCADFDITSDQAATTYTCSASSAGGDNEVTTVGIKRDATDPSLSVTGGPADGASYFWGSVPDAPTCSADDNLSGVAAPCAVSGYSSAVGSHTVTVSVSDDAGNETTVSRSYTVKAWTAKGFYAPVDMNGVYNTIKGGSTVPLKFELFAASELTSTSAVSSFTTKKITCSGTALEDAVEITSTGGTSLRYDSTAGQFIQNWKTPTGAGTCYSATMTAADGSSITAFFKLK